MESDETFLWNEPGKEVREDTLTNVKSYLLLTGIPAIREAWLLTRGRQDHCSDSSGEHRPGSSGYDRRGRSILPYLNKILRTMELSAMATASMFNEGSDRSHQYRRRLFLDLQAWNEGRLSALQEQHLHRYLAEFDFRYNNRCSRPKTKKRPARQGLH